MKNIQYLVLWVTISLLSLGAISACSSDRSTTATNPATSDVKTDPCAGKTATPTQGSVGGKLAQELQGKPVIVDIYATWCPACRNIAPTLAELKQKYAGKANFVVLNMTGKSDIETSETTATKLGLSKFLAENKTQTGSIAIIDPATGNILAQHRNNPDKNAYTSILDPIVSK